MGALDLSWFGSVPAPLQIVVSLAVFLVGVAAALHGYFGRKAPAPSLAAQHPDLKILGGALADRWAAEQLSESGQSIAAGCNRIGAALEGILAQMRESAKASHDRELADDLKRGLREELKRELREELRREAWPGTTTLRNTEG